MFKQTPKQQAIAATRRTVSIGDAVTINFGLFGRTYYLDGIVGTVVDFINEVNGYPTSYGVQYKDEDGRSMTCDCPPWAIRKWSRQIAD